MTPTDRSARRSNALSTALRRTTSYARAALAAAALVAMPTIAADAPLPGGTLRVALRGDPASLDCHAVESGHVAFALFPAYSTLLKYDPTDFPKIIGDLATSWTESPDHLVYTFRINAKARFHDGTPLTSKDVKATYERLRNPPPGVVSLRRPFFADIRSIDAPDPTTVRFTLSAPNAAMLSTFANPWNCIYSAAKLAVDPTFPSKTILGSGPFKLVEYTPGNRIVYEKFKDYFKPGLPYLDRVELVILANAAVVPAISSGQVNADFFTFSAPLRDQIARARGAKTVFETVETTTGSIVTFNTKRKPFDDPRVRRALALAIDRPQADQSLPKLISVHGTSPIYRTGEYALPPDVLATMPGFAPDIARSRDEAKRLLKEAGASDLKVTLLTPNTRDPYEVYGVFMVDTWRRIGVQVELKALDAAAYTAAKTARDFDAVLEWNSSQGLDPNEVLNKYVPGNPNNYSGADDPELVSLFEQIKRELDPAKRRDLARRFEVRLLEQVWMTPLQWATRTTAVDSDLRGWKTQPTFAAGVSDESLWWAKPGPQ